MAINKVIVNGKTKLDLTADTVTAEDVKQGVTFHDATGALKTGTKSGGMDGFYIEKVFDSSEIYNSNSTVSVDITTDGKYGFFFISDEGSYIYIRSWDNNMSTGYGRTVYVMSTQPITNISWFENSSSSSSSH